MYTTAHLAAGLIIGKITGDYPTALISSMAIDVDHLIPYAQQGILFKPKKFWRTTKDPKAGGRSFLHSFWAYAIIVVVICLFNLQVGLVFSLGYLGHFLLDFLDSSDFYPLYPLKKWDIKGFIGYFSKAELIFTLVLFAVYFLL